MMRSLFVLFDLMSRVLFVLGLTKRPKSSKTGLPKRPMTKWKSRGEQLTGIARDHGPLEAARARGLIIKKNNQKKEVSSLNEELECLYLTRPWA